MKHYYCWNVLVESLCIFWNFIQEVALDFVFYLGKSTKIQAFKVTNDYLSVLIMFKKK